MKIELELPSLKKYFRLLMHLAYPFAAIFYTWLLVNFVSMMSWDSINSTVKLIIFCMVGIGATCAAFASYFDLK